ncbi:hypothetical protein DY000_02057485 [Brassica cretica]|uniref:Uncharacterized protein n=1 Tax=Brassica cretica TaxID=69181 RepID=A0ABQ7AFT8_BRACR|nr:hypothetical protein DY000_02057485 [Brassica cretica]
MVSSVQWTFDCMDYSIIGSLMVMASMRHTVSEDTNKSFLLDYDSSIPFLLEDISKSMPNVEVAEIDPPPLIRQNTSFMFLLERSD